MGIHYKFSSVKDFNTIEIDDTAISVGAFKQKISQSDYKSKKNGDSHGLCYGTDFGLIVINAQTNEPYDDDNSLIPNNTTVLLRRVPGNKRGRLIDTTIIALPEIQTPLSQLKNNSSAVNDNVAVKIEYGLSCCSTVTSSSMKSGSHSDGMRFDNALELDDEDSKIKASDNTPALDWSGVNDNGKRSSKMSCGFRFENKVPHEGYVCRRCNVPGHFIQHCPTNGDPSYDFKRVKRVAAPVSQQDEAAFYQQFDLLPSKKPLAESSVPTELLCPLCKQVMKDAMMTGGCCFSSFCGKCIRDYLINSKLICVCGAAQVLIDSLIPNLTVRGTINRILETDVSVHSGGSSVASSVLLSAAESSEKEKKPSIDIVQDTGSKRKLSIGDESESMAKKSKVIKQESLNEASVCSEETSSQASTKAVAEAQQQADATEEEAQQKVVAAKSNAQQQGIAAEEKALQMSGEKATKKKKKKSRSSLGDYDESYMMAMNYYGYNPYWTGMQAGREGYMAPYHPYYYGGMPYNNAFGMQGYNFQQ